MPQEYSDLVKGHSGNEEFHGTGIAQPMAPSVFDLRELEELLIPPALIVAGRGRRFPAALQKKCAMDADGISRRYVSTHSGIGTRTGTLVLAE